MRFNLFKHHPKDNDNHVTIAGDTWQPAPLNLEQALELLFLLSPYISLLEMHWSEFQRALVNTTGERPYLLQALFMALSDEIKPAHITQAFAILLDKQPEWFANVKAVELVRALPVLDEINDFGGLLQVCRDLGLTVRYEHG